MRKIIRRAGAVLLVVLLVFSLINFSPITAKAATGDTLTIYCWNDEILNYVIKYMPGYTEGRDKYHGMLDGVPVEWIQITTSGGEYQKRLNKDLFNDADVDIFLTEPGYSQLYCRPGIAKSLDSLGITSTELSKQFAYTQQYATYGGKIYGSDIYCCPGIMIYNREIARKVLGTDDPVQVQAKVSNWDKFNSVANQMSNAGYLMTASSDFLFRPYAATNTSSWVVDNCLNVDGKYLDWANECRSLYQKGQTRACDLWDSSTDYYDNISFCVFGPKWFWDFCMGYGYDDSIADRGGWAVCEGPQAFDWGGTILSVAEKSDNVSAATKLIRAMTFNDTVAKSIVSGEGDYTYFINNKSAINYCAGNASYNSYVLGNQNPFSVMQTAVEHINASDISGYDYEILDMFTTEMRDYINGTISYENAYANFQHRVSEKYPNFNLPYYNGSVDFRLQYTESGVDIKIYRFPNISKYEIARKNSSGEWQTLAVVSGDTYLDTNVQVGNSYTYTVWGLDADGKTHITDDNIYGKRIIYKEPGDEPQLEDEGSVLTIHCWNDEFRELVEYVLPTYRKDNYDDYLGYIGDIEVRWVLNSNSYNGYVNHLDSALADDNEDVDIFLLESDYSKKYAKPGIAMSMDELGFDEYDLAGQYPFTKQVVSSGGKQYGSAWQALGGGMIYNRDIAKSVLGTDDPNEVQKKVSDWDKWLNVAYQMKAKGYRMTPCAESYFRVFSNNTNAPLVKDNKVYLDASYSKWVDLSKEMTDNGLTVADRGIWDSEYEFERNTAFCLWGPDWYFNWCMRADENSSIASRGGWAFCEGPQTFFWGGTWICVAEKTDNAKTAAYVLEQMTLDEYNLQRLCEYTPMTPNSSTVVNHLASDSYWGNSVLGGQNYYTVLKDSMPKINADNLGVYDTTINSIFQDEMRSYFLDTKTKDEAINDFFNSVREMYPELSRGTLLSTPVVNVEAVNGGISVTWDAVPGAENYRVFRKTGTGSWKTLVTQKSIGYTDKALSNGETYTYTVRCMDAAGAKYTSDFDKVGKTIVYQGKLSTPDVTVKMVDTGIQISWKAVAGAENYRVFRKTESGTWKTLATQTETTYTDTTPKNGETYTYTVRCMDKTGTKYTSDFDKVGKTIKYQKDLDIPKLTVKVVDGGVQIEWNAVSGAENYRVFRKTETTTWKTLATQNTTSYKDTAVKNGETYTYTVRCMDAAGTKYTSGLDKVGKTIKYQSGLDIPVFTVKNTDTGVLVEWNAVDGAENYRVFKKTGTGSWKTLVTQTTTSYLDSAVKEGTSYTYTVRCMDASGTEYTSSFNKDGILIQYQKPTQPQSGLQTPELTVEMTETGVRIYWNAVEGAAQYRVFRKVNGGTWKVVTTLAATEYVDTNVVEGKTYTYTVRCVNEDGSQYTSGFDKEGKTIVFAVPVENTVESSAEETQDTIEELDEELTSEEQEAVIEVLSEEPVDETIE